MRKESQQNGSLEEKLWFETINWSTGNSKQEGIFICNGNLSESSCTERWTTNDPVLYHEKFCSPRIVRKFDVRISVIGPGGTRCNFCGLAASHNT